MKAIVTGACGFAGGYLVSALLSAGHQVAGLTGKTRVFSHPFARLSVPLCSVDIAQADEVAQCVEQEQPDWIFHLAAKTFVPDCERDPVAAFECNVMGSMHVAQAMMRLQKTCRMIYISSAEVYGRKETDKLSEETPPDPATVYAVSKYSAELMLRQYAQHNKTGIVFVRPFNHSGPGQRDHFVLSAFARQVARIERGQQEPKMRVGNLETQRDFIHAADMAKGYILAAQKGLAGRIYNLGMGKGVTIGHALNTLLAFSSKKIKVETNPELLRKTDVSRFVADNTRARTELGWEPSIGFDRLLRELYEDWLIRCG